MSASQEQAVQLLNDIKLAGDATEKGNLLKGLQEIVVKKDASLIPSFLPEVLELQVDPSPAVRRQVLDFFDAAMQTAPDAATLLQGLYCISHMLQDSVAATVKRAVVSAYPTYRAALAVIVAQGSGGASADVVQQLQDLWQAAGGVKTTIASLATTPTTNSGVKLSACKFIEQGVMLLTADSIPAVAGVLPTPQKLPPDNPIVSKALMARDGEQLLSSLVTLLRSIAEQEDSGPVALTCIRAGMTIIQQRPQFIGRILPVLLALTKTRKYKIGEEGPANHSSTLKAALTAALDSRHPMATTWRKKVGDGLVAMGAVAAAEPNPPAPRGSKRPREEEDAAPQIQAPAPGQPTPMPGTAPSATIAEQADTVLRTLVASKDAPNLAAFVSSIQPDMLIDLFLQYLPNLPPRHAWIPDYVPHEPWLDDLIHRLQAPVAAAGDGATTLAAAQGTQNGQVGGEQGALNQQRESEEPSAAMEIEEEAPVLLIPVPIPDDVLAPLEMSEQEQAKQRRNAVLRILSTEKTGAHALRTALVGRLAACAPDTDRITDSLLDHIFEDFHGRRGLDVVMTLLYFLFAEKCGGEADDTETDEHPVSSIAADLTGSRYEDVLLSVLERMQDSLPPSDRTLVTVLLDAPALPMPRVQDFLSSLCTVSSEHATLALVAARDVALARPPSRTEVLLIVLNAATSVDVDLRTKAVRLLANRLFPEPPMTEPIEVYARSKLDELTSLQPAVVVVEAPAVDGNGGEAEMETEESGKVAVKEEATIEGDKGINDEAAAATEEEGTETTTQPEPPSGPTPSEHAARLCALYCALCTKKHSLVRHLFTVFAESSEPGKEAVLANAPGLAKTLGAVAPALLNVVQDPPAGSLDLVLNMLSTLTEVATPPPALVAACLQLFASCKDPRILPPVLPGMERATVLRFMPSILELPVEMLKIALARLCTPTDNGQTEPLFAPSELLAALHTFDTSGDASVLRHAMTAINICINTPDLFPAEVLAATINQLLTRVPLPQLFMRTVIQSLAAAPRLRPYVVSVLSQLAAKQIWNDATQWRGWVMAAQQTAPESFPALLQLPAQVLGQALPAVPAPVRAQLVQYVDSPQCQVAVSQATKEVLAFSQAPPPVAAAAADGN